MKLLVKPHNRELLQTVAEMMSDSSLTSALNFILETQGPIALKQLEAIRTQGNPSASTQRAIATPPRIAAERQAYVPELDGDAVSSAFD